MISLKNTLKAITSLLNDVPHYTLLWTNPNPTSSFSAQTISLDLSKYDAVEVISYMSIWNSDIQDSIMLEVGGLYGWLLGFDNMEGSNIIRHNKRRLKVTKSGVVFETATSKYNTTTQNSDGHLVPYKIYGIKFGGGGIRLSVLSSLRRWLYAKLESHTKSDWGEHHHNQECLGRKGNEVYWVWNACDYDIKLVHDTERWGGLYELWIQWRIYIYTHHERRREQSGNRALCRTSRQLWISQLHDARIQRAKSEGGQWWQNNRFLRSILSLHLMPKGVFA